MQYLSLNRIRELTSSRIGLLTRISGQVVRTHPVHPELVSGTFLCTVIHPKALSPATRHQTNFPALKIEIWTTGDHSYSLESCYKINYSNDSILCLFKLANPASPIPSHRNDNKSSFILSPSLLSLDPLTDLVLPHVVLGAVSHPVTWEM